MDGAALGAFALVLAWLCGLRVYVTAFALGLAHALSLVVLPGSLELLAQPWLLAASGLLCVVEFVTDKIPGVDSAWDLIQTVVRVPAGALAAGWAMAPELSDPSWGWLGTGAGVALISHGLKSGTRAMLNASPEPFSNWGASVSEDILCLVVLLLVVSHPLIALALVLICVLLMIGIVWVLWRMVGRLFRRRPAPPA